MMQEMYQSNYEICNPYDKQNLPQPPFWCFYKQAKNGCASCKRSRHKELFTLESSHEIIKIVILQDKTVLFDDILQFKL